MIELTPFITKHYGSLAGLHAFCVALPKAELHAHVNGSISPETMRELVERKKEAKPHLAKFQVPEKLKDITDFFQIFKFIYQLTDDENSIRTVVRAVIDEFAADGVRYLELRSTPRRCEETGTRLVRCFSTTSTNAG
ncbi:hypothetical protein BC936DRAFT_143608 [Jimgerdemannia flammicorona]|uniref:Adenosine deaminase domain-containing protein n=1 Tax=Jimgerdemannia flammicorona TaxID=994334 RepID=A0A432ZZ08_9FUNG|nr:hypothetical protein BC936DRAFT_143608 [Jimgerdemannia flammicorona]